MHVTRRVRRLAAAWLVATVLVVGGTAGIAAAMRLAERGQVDRLREAALLPGLLQLGVGSLYIEAGMLVLLTGASAEEVPSEFASYATIDRPGDTGVNVLALRGADARGVSALESIGAAADGLSIEARTALAPLPQAVLDAIDANTLVPSAIAFHDYASAATELTYAAVDAQNVSAALLATTDPAPRSFVVRLAVATGIIAAMLVALGVMLRVFIGRTVKPVEAEALALRHHNAQLQVLLYETRRLSTLRRDEAGPDLPSLAGQIAGAAASLVDADYAVVFLVAGNSLRAAGGWGGAAVGEVRVGEGVLGAVVESGTSQRASVSFEPALPLETDPVLVVLPLVAGAAVTGALVAGTRSGRRFGEEQETLLRLLALSAATALENVRAYTASEELAVIDELTGLYNKRRLQTDLARLASRARIGSRALACAMLDVDHFKTYNDTHGHPAGDVALRRVAELLRANVRVTDLVYRYGGEEFTVLLPDTGPDEARAVVERIRAGVEQAWFAGEERQPLGRVTVSIGLAGSPPAEPDQLVGAADTALYAAKAAGRNRVLA